MRLSKLLDNLIENGLFSRFLFYYLDKKTEWIDVLDEGDGGRYCGPVGASGRASQGIGRLEDCSPLYTTRLESSRGGGGTASASIRSPGTYLRPESLSVCLSWIFHAGRRASSRTTAFRLLPSFRHPAV